MHRNLRAQGLFLVALVVVLGIFMVFTSSPVFAQGGESGGVTGIVKDSSGAIVPGATVELYNESTGELERSQVTGTPGSFTFEALRPGPYRLEVTAKGFRKYVVRFSARLNEVTHQDTVLEVGAITETVTVQAASTIINTEAPTTGQPIDNRTLTTLPLAEPNYLFLLGLSPGTGGEPADVRKAGRANVDISVGGQRTSNNSVTMEGVSINDFNLAHFDYLPIPNPEAIQEFKIATSLYDASLGSKGGGALALVLKTGTNSYHGGALWNVRNDFFNANEWFFNAGKKPRQKLTQNVAGLNLGGPFPWPIVKGFFFFNVEATRGRNAIDPNGSTITNQTFNAFPTNPDGTTSAALLAAQASTANVPLTAASIDPVAVSILNTKGTYYGGTYFIPRPGQAGCGSTVTAGGPGDTGTFVCNFSKVAIVSDTQYTGTYDRPLRHDKDKVLVRVFWDDGGAVAGLKTASDLAAPLSSPIKNRFGTVSYTSQITNRQLNEVRFGANRFVFATIPTDLMFLSQVGATRANMAQFPGLYRFGTGTFTFGTGVNDDRGTASNMYQIGDNWSLIMGRHTLRAGGDLYRWQLNRFNNFASRGSLGFAPSGPSLTAGATEWQNFITGTITSTQSGAGNPQRYFRAWSGDMYVQDDFHWSSRLTVNLGVRWEPMQFAHDKFFRNSNYDFRLAQKGKNPFLFPGSLNLQGFKGTPGVSDCTLSHCWDLTNFGPRVGFAWDMSGNQKTVVRGGYGVYFQQISNQAELQGSLGFPFFAQLITTRDTAQSQKPLQLANPFPAQPGGGGGGYVLTANIPQKSSFVGLLDANGNPCFTSVCANDPGATVLWADPSGAICGVSGGPASDCSIDLASFTSSAPDLHTPYTQQWNLSIQRELGHNWALELGYVGDHGIGGIAIWVPVQAKLGSPAKPITVVDSAGNSYSITNNTSANETLREQALGLTFLNGASYTSNVGNQIYHSLQVLLSHRFEHGLFMQTSYTYGKNIDNVSGSINTDELNGSTGRGGAGIFNDQSNVALNRALSDLDRRHRLSIAYGYQIPVPHSGILGSQLFQGWAISGVVTAQSGQLFTLADGFAGGAYGFVLGTPLAICRSASRQIPTLPTCTPGTPTRPSAAQTSGSIESRLRHFINPNLFSHPVAVANSNDPSATGFGTYMRNIYRGPFQSDVDFSITKTFHITERHQFELRGDAFNLFNHPVFSIPTCGSCLDLAAGTGNIGRITSTVIPERLIQVGLKYTF